MLKRYNNWYRTLTPLMKVLVSFILNWLYWFIAWLIAEQFFFEEKRSLNYHVFHATWMATFMLIPFNWIEIKQILKSQNKELKSSKKDKPEL